MTAAPSFYEELTLRNRGFISERAQERLGAATILVAGCRSTGGAAVEPLVRLGAQHLLLADNGAFELNNLNRQHAAYADIGFNKARVARDRVLAINPQATAEAEENGITPANVRRLVRAADLVVDGVDVTERSGWHAKFLLHQEAAAANVPVITGWDMAGVQYIRFYDYRRRGARAFDGKVTAEDVRDLGIWALLLRGVPLRFVPVEMIRNAREHLQEPEYSVPQLVYASQFFGALAARMAVVTLDRGAVRRHTVIDAHQRVRNRRERTATTLARTVELMRVAGLIRSLR